MHQLEAKSCWSSTISKQCILLSCSRREPKNLNANVSHRVKAAALANEYGLLTMLQVEIKCSHYGKQSHTSHKCYKIHGDLPI